MADTLSWEHVQQQASQSGITPYQYMANNNISPSQVAGYVAAANNNSQPTNGNSNTNNTGNGNTNTNNTNNNAGNGTLANNPTVVPGVAQGNNQINIADYGGQLATNPSLALQQDDPATPNINESMELSDRVPTASQDQINSGLVDPNNHNLNPSGVQANTAQGTASTAAQPNGNTQAAQVQTATTENQVAQNQMTGAQGNVSAQSQIDPAAILADLDATAAGTNPVGAAIKEAAQQDFTNIIDTSTLAGKLLAQQLGEGNYTDAKATLKGQLDILQGEFTNANGEPTIPAWAASTARNVQKIAAFKGMTGTAAVAALSQALMEASIPIAQQDAQFFQTLTLENLNNRQEATINRANVLAKLDLANMDAKLTAAVNNSQAFLQMDMKNLDNEQQARLINNQARIQSILEDAKAENTNRLFMADSQNDKDKFYSELEASINQFNAAQQNAMEQMNVGEANDMNQFNSAMEDAREQFYATMQYNIDTANAKWRQEITVKDLDQKFEAAATDVRNMVGISVEQLNQLWDRADSLLDYAWNAANNEADRKNQIALVTLQGQLQQNAADSKGFGEILGSILGAGASALFGWLF